MGLISSVCVEESKWHIESEKAVRKIRNYIYHPDLYEAKDLIAYINMKTGKISGEEYRKITLGIDDD